MRSIRSKQNRLLAALLILFCLCAEPLCARAADNDMTNLRVGYFAFDGYHNIAEDGTRSGYGYDLLQLMARYADIEYTYCAYDKSLAACEHLLADGEIDLLTAIKWSEDRAEKFDFSSRSIGTAATQITVKAGNTNVVAGDYSTYDGLVFGVLKGTTRGKELAEFAREHGFTYQSIYFDTTRDMARALQEGQVDALVGTSLRARSNEWTLDSFNEAPIYAVVRKGDTKTLELVNHALDRMELEESHWHTDLPQKYYNDNRVETIFLTQTERMYLEKQREEGRVFRVLVNPDRHPYSYVQDGQMAGIMIDLFDIIARRAGINYEWIVCTDREDYAQRMINEETDICIDMTPDFYLAENLGYIITDVYLTAPFSWIRRNDSKGDIRTAAKLIYTQLTPAQYAYNNAHHEIDYIEYATAQECIQSVKDGVTDGYCAYTYQAEQIILHDPSNSLMASIAQTENEFVIGTTHHIDRNLDSILNKAVSTMTDWDRVEAIRRHTAFVPPEYSLLALLRENTTFKIMIVSTVMILILLFIIIIQERRLQKRLKSTIRRQKKRLNESMEDMLQLLASAIEFRSSESGDHVKRISSVTREVIEALTRMYPDTYSFTQQQISQIATASVLHDVGKIAIPDYVLNKPGKLTPEEFKLMQQHPVKGCELLDRIPNLHNDPLYAYSYDICRWHHERWDGMGYPDGLKGNEIPIWAQAASIADVFDALISPRVYKEAYSIKDAIAMICNGQCGQFNPKVIEAFLSVADHYQVPEAEEPAPYKAAPASRDTTTLMLSAFQYLISNSSDIVFLKDVDLVYRAASPSFAAFLDKRSVDEIICHTDAQILPDEQAARRYEAEDRKMLASGQNLIDSLDMLPMQNGKQRYGSTSKYLLTDSQGRIMGILGITRDVTSIYYANKHHRSTINTLFNLPGNAYYSAYLDLTDWKIVEEKTQKLHGYEVQPHQSVSDISQEALLYIRDRRTPAYKFFKEFTFEALNELYESGKHKIILEFLCRFLNNAERWLRCEIRFMVDPTNGHLCITMLLLDIHEQKEEEFKIIDRAEHDSLTGLLNRSSVSQLTDQTLADKQASSSMHALFIIDLDDFKHINDTWGHRAGDDCLKTFAQVLKSMFRSTDLVGRLGGDEFIIFMRFVATREVVEEKAAALLDAINRAKTDYSGVTLNASIGISLYQADGINLDQLYERADKAMYHAKHLGKNKYFFAGDL